MSLTLVQDVWLTNPAALLQIDLADPDSINRLTSLTEVGMGMENHGWRKLGTADIQYHITQTVEHLAQAAVEATRQAIQKLDADTEVKRNALLETISKLQTLTWNGESTDPGPHFAAEPVVDWLDVVQQSKWKCVKTGCAFEVGSAFEVGIVRTSPEAIYWGDLFYSDGTEEYLFNCANDTPVNSPDLADHEYLLQADVESDTFTSSYAGFPRLFLVGRADAVRSEALATFMEQHA